jgi:hypothetical protein
MNDNDIICKIDAERLAQRIIDQSNRMKGWSMRGRAAYHARQDIVGRYANS